MVVVPKTKLAASLCLVAPLQSVAFAPVESILSSHFVNGAQDVLIQAQHATMPVAIKLQESAAHNPISAKIRDVVLQHMQNGHFDPSNSKLLKSYGRLLLKYPLMTKALTAAILSTVGDAIAQRSSDAPKGYDPNRGASFAMFAAIYTGAFQHFWFGWENDKLAFTAAEISSTLAVFFASSASVLPTAKLILNQFLVVPFLYMPLFFGFTGSMAGLTQAENIDRAKQMYTSLLLRNWFFWLPAQFVQFAFVASEWQIPYLCLASLAWTIILSSTSTSSAAPTHAEEVASAAAMTKLSDAIDLSAMTVLDEDAVTLGDIGDAFAEATADVTDALVDMTEAEAIAAS